MAVPKSNESNILALLALVGAYKIAEEKPILKPILEEKKVLPKNIDYQQLMYELERRGLKLEKQPISTTTVPSSTTLPESGFGKGIDRMILILNSMLTTACTLKDDLVRALMSLSKIYSEIDLLSQHLVSSDYRSGKIEASDSEFSSVWGGARTRSVSFFAGSLGWEIRMLTRSAQNSGKTIENMNVIYLPEGSSWEKDIDVVQVQARCPDATDTSQGILYWEVDF